MLVETRELDFWAHFTFPPWPAIYRVAKGSTTDRCTVSSLLPDATLGAGAEEVRLGGSAVPGNSA